MDRKKNAFAPKIWIAARRVRIERALDRALPDARTPPAALHRAMRYSVLAGGKRLRPLLCLAAAEAVGGAPATGDDLLRVAAAIELLHTYTLIHDDLPAMDNDALRRGRPTCHIVFGEATAILAGDALLTRAFELLGRFNRPPPAATGGRLTAELAAAAGSRGVVGGQSADMAAEGRPPTAARLRFIHRHKTGDLIRAAARLGALATGADTRRLAALSRYADHLGLAFQIRDDLLNATSRPETLGKAAGSDAARGKCTWVALHGIPAARHAVTRKTQAALAALDGIAWADARPLRALARLLQNRDQ